MKRIGVVGVGYLGSHHARILSNLPGVKLACVIDVDEQKAKSIAEKYNTCSFGDIDRAMDKIDAAVVAVPTVLHHDVTMRLINAGKDVLLEKPIASSMVEANELVTAAEKKNIILQIGHLERFNGAILGIAEYIKTPLFIESHRLGPFAARGVDVDVALDLMIHDIDVILSIVKSRVKDVKAVGVPVLSSSIDISNARLEFESGCVANITASRVSVEKMRKIRIFQHDSYLSLDYQKQELKRYMKTVPTNIDPKTLNLDNIKDLSAVEIKMEELSINKEEPLLMELKSFAECIENRTQPIVSGKDGKDALEVAIHIKEASKEKLAKMSVT